MLAEPRAALDFDESTHTYRLDGKVVPSVTQLLAPLQSWEHVPPDVLDRKSKLGTAVHLATYFDDKGTLDPTFVSEEVAGYLAAWRRFRAEKQPTLLHRERKVVHRCPDYAGTLDVEMKMDGELYVADIKSGVKHRVHGVQIAGYVIARRQEEGWATYPRRAGIYLSADGRYEIVPYIKASDYSMFLSMTNLHNWKETA